MTNRKRSESPNEYQIIFLQRNDAPPTTPSAGAVQTINHRANTHDTHHLSTQTPARLAPPASVTVAAGG